MDLYHRDIRLPDNFRLPARIIRLAWTKHALRALTNDRYGFIPKFDHVDLSTKEVIEVGMTGRRVEKVVIRGDLDSINDLIYVLIPKGMDAWIVKTVWINRKNDSHKTLDRSRYVV
jgi:hypothetical protein